MDLVNRLRDKRKIKNNGKFIFFSSVEWEVTPITPVCGGTPQV
jgi:hypothetical protein